MSPSKLSPVAGAAVVEAGRSHPPGAQLNRAGATRNDPFTSSANSSSITLTLRGNPRAQSDQRPERTPPWPPRLPPQVARLGVQSGGSSDDLLMV